MIYMYLLLCMLHFVFQYLKLSEWFCFTELLEISWVYFAFLYRKYIIITVLSGNNEIR